MNKILERLNAIIEAKEDQIKWEIDRNLSSHTDLANAQEEVRELKSIVMDLEQKLKSIRNQL